jgi:hypothetical protein
VYSFFTAFLPATNMNLPTLNSLQLTIDGAIAEVRQNHPSTTDRRDFKTSELLPEVGVG